MLKYTEGPWIWNIPMDADYISIQASEDYTEVARIPEIGYFASEEQKGNRNIILAAPDMYEALTGLMAWCVANVSGWSFPMYDVAAKAIQKAEGKEGEVL